MIQISVFFFPLGDTADSQFNVGIWTVMVYSCGLEFVSNSMSIFLADIKNYSGCMTSPYFLHYLLRFSKIMNGAFIFFSFCLSLSTQIVIVYMYLWGSYVL